jgi:HTH-type transcriptional regulator / antitoxin HipB
MSGCIPVVVLYIYLYILICTLKCTFLCVTYVEHATDIQEIEVGVKAMNAREVGAQLRHAREQLGLTQLEVATSAGVQRPWLARLESGRGNPTLSSLFAVLGALGMGLNLEEGNRTDQIAADDLQPPVDLDQLLQRYRHSS